VALSVEDGPCSLELASVGGAVNSIPAITSNSSWPLKSMQGESRG